jgi:NADPH:quinone reductase-like Zn-dependent oxidoreductase
LFANVAKPFARAVEATAMIPMIDKVFSFNEVKEAYRYLESQKHIGKVVIDAEG